MSEETQSGYDRTQILAELVERVGTQDKADSLIKAKVVELEGFITEEAALITVATEYGVTVYKETPTKDPSTEPLSLSITSIAEAWKMPPKSYIHLKGIILSASDQLTARNGNKYHIATFHDSSCAKPELNATLMLWGDQQKYSKMVGKPLIIEHIQTRFYEDRLQLKFVKNTHVHAIVQQKIG